SITVHNPYDEPTIFQLDTVQNGDRFRTYLETTELELDAGETEVVTVMFEYTATNVQEREREENDVRINGLIYDPRAEDEDYPFADAADAAGGVDIRVRTGLATEFTEFKAQVEGKRATFKGTVGEVGAGIPVTGGDVLVAIRHGDPSDPDYTYVSELMGSNGVFEVSVSETDVLEGKAWFLGGATSTPYAPSESDWVQ
ncbi:MAG: hypothetical protein GY884_13645, partial [Proteobacteria bacterium]|nr:hypothetical protein [Pseudomonadota bacterium]